MNDYEVSTKTAADIEKNFTYHSPIGDQPNRYTLLRDEAKALAYRIVRNTPYSREQALALTHLENAIFWANAAIARNEIIALKEENQCLPGDTAERGK